jgi:S-adenosylmethionine:tRNA ribosyltransferase-isomerase
MTGAGEERGATDLRVTDFDFDLPPELIAQQPAAVRGQSRMLVMDRTTGTLHHDSFTNLDHHMRPGDLLVLNDSRVIPARLYARRTLRREKETPTGRIEVMLTESASAQDVGAPSSRPHLGARVGKHNPQPIAPNRWHALVRPGRKVAIGEVLVFPDAAGEILLQAEVVERGEFGERTLEFAPVENFDEIPAEDGFFSILDRIGHIPLPPYIRRDDEVGDRARYQTVFAEERGSVAAPTAGLHFTAQLLEDLKAQGIEIAQVTLHVGLGTFAPLHVEKLSDVRLHKERYSLSSTTADALNRAVREKRRIVAVGTTTVRTLESAAAIYPPGQLQRHSGETNIFISPGFNFRLVNALLTNFHLPQSSLLMLVSAFAGREQILYAYQHAVQEKYRFFSYGDCMFIA